MTVDQDVVKVRPADDPEAVLDASCWHALWKHSRDGIVILDETGKVWAATPSYAAMLGYTEDEVRDLHVWDWDARWGSAELKDMIVEVDRTGDRFETVHRRKDGSTYDVEICTTGVVWHDHKLIVCICRDITERRRLQEQLLQAQKQEAIGQLAGGIAHDFNNLLAVVLGNAELAFDRRGEPDPDDAATYLQAIIRAGERARDLVRKMFALSRSAGVRDVSPCDLGPLIDEAIDLLRAAIPSSIEITTDIAADLPPVRLSAVDLHQLLANLIINARDAVGERGRIVVTYRLHQPRRFTCDACRGQFAGDHVELTVRDDGCGIASEHRARLFEPYFTTKETGKGTGLGLAVVLGLLHEAGGHVLVESTPGEGAAFRLLLPAQPASSPVAAPSPPLAGRGDAGPERHLLVVDDEAAVATMLGEMLERRGYRATIITSSQDAWARFQADPDAFDGVISDLTMPHLGGIALLTRIRELRPHLPVVLCSGYHDPLDAATLPSHRFSAILQKPVGLGELTTAVDSMFCASPLV